MSLKHQSLLTDGIIGFALLTAIAFLFNDLQLGASALGGARSRARRASPGAGIRLLKAVRRYSASVNTRQVSNVIPPFDVTERRVLATGRGYGSLRL
jgi:hypothetical protein